MRLLLCVWPYQYDHHQLPNQDSSGNCRSQQQFSPHTLHYGHCTWLRGSHQPAHHVLDHALRLDRLLQGSAVLDRPDNGNSARRWNSSGGFGAERAIESQGSGCFRKPRSVTAAQALLLETVSSFAFLVLAFGVALDPRQQKLFRPLVGPLAVGCSLGIVSFASAGMVPGYTGATMNPARCFAFAITRRNFVDQWIWWLGPFCGSWLLAITYVIAPPYHSSLVPTRRKNKQLQGGGNVI